MHQSYRRLHTITGLAGMLLSQAACSSSDAAAGKLVVVDRMTNALAGADITSVSGEYGTGCTEREIGERWSVGSAPRFPELSVVMNNADCELIFTDIALVHLIAPASVFGDPAILLTDTYFATASSFSADGFYANAKLSAAGFAADFDIILLYSDEPSQVDDDNVAAFAVTESRAIAEEVPAPSIALDMAGVTVAVDLDGLVTYVLGSAAVVDTTLAGDAGVGAVTYVVVTASGTALDTYGEIDAVFVPLTDVPLGATIPAADFILTVGAATPQTRSLIIANTVEGIRSYTVFTITFNPAT